MGAKSRDKDSEIEPILHTTDNRILSDFEGARIIQNKGFRSKYGDIAYNYLIGR